MSVLGQHLALDLEKIGMASCDLKHTVEVSVRECSVVAPEEYVADGLVERGSTEVDLLVLAVSIAGSYCAFVDLYFAGSSVEAVDGFGSFDSVHLVVDIVDSLTVDFDYHHAPVVTFAEKFVADSFLCGVVRFSD